MPARIRPADSRLVTAGALRRGEAEALGESDEAGGGHAREHRGVADPDRDAHQHGGLPAPREVQAADERAPADDEERRGHDQGAESVERPDAGRAAAPGEEVPQTGP